MCHFVKIYGDIFLVIPRMINLDRIFISVSIFVVNRLISYDPFVLIFMRVDPIFGESKCELPMGKSRV